MTSAPFMQLYIADYLGDTQHLTTEQHGAYLLLLMTMWRHEGRLPNDPAKLARIARVNMRRWHMISDDVMAFFDVDGDAITQKRLVQEHQKATSISEKRSNIGRLGGLAKSLKNNDQGLAKAKQLLKHSQIPEPDIKKETKVSKKNQVQKVEKPEGVDDQTWTDFQALRKQKRAPISITAMRGIEREAAKAKITMQQALALMVARGWQGFNASWLKPDEIQAAQTPVQSVAKERIEIHREPHVFDAAVIWSKSNVPGFVETDRSWIDVPADVAVNLRKCAKPSKTTSMLFGGLHS